MPGVDPAVNGRYGTAVRRREDPPLIQSLGTYTDDVVAPDALHAVFVRAEMAHGRIAGIDTRAAASAPGVVGVFTACDLGLGPMPPGPMAPSDMLRPILAQDVVHSDTGRVPRGMGTMGSRSLQVGGSAIVNATREVLAKGRELAAHLFEAAVDDVQIVPGRASAWRAAPPRRSRGRTWPRRRPTRAGCRRAWSPTSTP